jgi:hypothetical protein
MNALEDRLCRPIKEVDLRFTCLLCCLQSRFLRSFKWNTQAASVRMGFLRLKQRIVQSNRLRFVPALAFSFPVLCLDAPGKIVCLLTGSFEGWEVVSLPLDAELNPPAELRRGVAR